MSTNRTDKSREKAREERMGAFMNRPKVRRRQKLRAPDRPLNPDQQALRRVLERDFFGNRQLMAEAIGLTSGGLAKYVQSGVSSPDYELMERVAKAIGLSVDQLRAEGRGDIYIVGSDEWIEGDAPEDAQKRLKLISKLVPSDPDHAADLDDL